MKVAHFAFWKYELCGEWLGRWGPMQKLGDWGSFCFRDPEQQRQARAVQKVSKDHGEEPQRRGDLLVRNNKRGWYQDSALPFPQHILTLHRIPNTFCSHDSLTFKHDHCASWREHTELSRDHSSPVGAHDKNIHQVPSQIPSSWSFLNLLPSTLYPNIKTVHRGHWWSSLCQTAQPRLGLNLLSLQSGQSLPLSYHSLRWHQASWSLSDWNTSRLTSWASFLCDSSP